MKMLVYERINISDGIHVNKSDESKELCSVTIGIFYIRALATGHIFVIDAIT